MIFVQAIDDRFYGNAKFDGGGWLAHFGPGAVELLYLSKKLVSWRTAARFLRPAGIKARQKSLGRVSYAVFHGKLRNCVAFELTLTGPIPIPSTYEAVLMSSPGPDVEIIEFKMKKRGKKRNILAHDPSLSLSDDPEPVKHSLLP